MDDQRTRIGNTPTCEDCGQPTDHCGECVDGVCVSDEELAREFLALTPEQQAELQKYTDPYANGALPFCDICGHAAAEHESDAGFGPCFHGSASGNTCPCGQYDDGRN